jgi:hypothetical protein
MSLYPLGITGNFIKKTSEVFTPCNGVWGKAFSDLSPTLRSTSKALIPVKPYPLGFTEGV